MTSIRFSAWILFVLLFFSSNVFVASADGKSELPVAALLRGSAVEGSEVRMNRLTPKGDFTGVFEAYLQLGQGVFHVLTVSEQGDTLQWGQGSASALQQNGNPFQRSASEVVRVRLDSRQQTISVTPVSVHLKGNIVPPGTCLNYAGKGVWRSEVELDDSEVFLFSDKYFYFTFNEDERLAVKRLRGSRTAVAMPSEGFRTENIRINGGRYLMELDMTRRTWNVWAPVDEHRISAFGSSVCNGEGAEGRRGYAYMLGTQLAQRRENGTSDTPFTVSGVSIGGNTTRHLLGRYDEMLHDFGRYVLIGLSLGNEGIHGSSNQKAVYKQFTSNMRKIIDQCRADGRIPVVMNNYTRADFNADDYHYVQLANLDIHQWDVPSVNVLGAIDDGQGRWADGYVADAYHQNTEGHKEFLYAIPPSLFDALHQGKPYPVRHTYHSLQLGKDSVLRFSGEGTVHSFTVSLRIKGGQKGSLLSVRTADGECGLHVGKGGSLQYVAQGGDKLTSQKGVLTDTAWHCVTLTHYYARHRTLVYVDSKLVGEIDERLVPEEFCVGDGKKNSRQYSELSFWRSGMTAMEIEAYRSGRCLRSSLEIYTPLDRSLRNHAQSLNSTLRFANKK